MKRQSQNKKSSTAGAKAATTPQPGTAVEEVEREKSPGDDDAETYYSPMLPTLDPAFNYWNHYTTSTDMFLRTDDDDEEDTDAQSLNQHHGMPFQHWSKRLKNKKIETMYTESGHWEVLQKSDAHAKKGSSTKLSNTSKAFTTGTTDATSMLNDAHRIAHYYPSDTLVPSWHVFRPWISTPANSTVGSCGSSSQVITRHEAEKGEQIDGQQSSFRPAPPSLTDEERALIRTELDVIEAIQRKKKKVLLIDSPNRVAIDLFMRKCFGMSAKKQSEGSSDTISLPTSTGITLLLLCVVCNEPDLTERCCYLGADPNSPLFLSHLSFVAIIKGTQNYSLPSSESIPPVESSFSPSTCAQYYYRQGVFLHKPDDGGTERREQHSFVLPHDPTHPGDLLQRNRFLEAENPDDSLSPLTLKSLYSPLLFCCPTSWMATDVCKSILTNENSPCAGEVLLNRSSTLRYHYHLYSHQYRHMFLNGSQKNTHDRVKDADATLAAPMGSLNNNTMCHGLTPFFVACVCNNLQIVSSGDEKKKYS